MRKTSLALVLASLLLVVNFGINTNAEVTRKIFTLDISQMKVKLNFKTEGKDHLFIKGSYSEEAGDAGEITSLTLGENSILGRISAKDLKIRQHGNRFSIKLRKGDLQKMGVFSKDTSAEELNIHVGLSFEKEGAGVAYLGTTVSLKYKVKNQRGKAVK